MVTCTLYKCHVYIVQVPRVHCTSATCTYVEDYFRYYIFVTRLLIQSDYGGFEKIVRPNLIMKIFITKINKFYEFWGTVSSKQIQTNTTEKWSWLFRIGSPPPPRVHEKTATVQVQVKKNVFN